MKLLQLDRNVYRYVRTENSEVFPLAILKDDHKRPIIHRFRSYYSSITLPNSSSCILSSPTPHSTNLSITSSPTSSRCASKVQDRHITKHTLHSALGQGLGLGIPLILLLGVLGGMYHTCSSRGCTSSIGNDGEAAIDYSDEVR